MWPEIFHVLDAHTEISIVWVRYALFVLQLPNDNWPDWSDYALEESMEDWLGPWIPQKLTRGQLRSIDLSRALLRTLNEEQQRSLSKFMNVLCLDEFGVREHDGNMTCFRAILPKWCLL